MSLVDVPDPSPSIADALTGAQPGDVVLLTPCEPPDIEVPIARLIREATKAPVSHSLVVVDGGRYIDIRVRPDGKPVAISPLSGLYDMHSLRGCWLLRHARNDDPAPWAFRASIVESARAALNSRQPINFGLSELKTGLLLLLTRRSGPTLIKALGLQDQIRRVVRASPDEMFCSELTYRVFADATQAAGLGDYKLDCHDMLLRGWFELLNDGPESGTPAPLCVEEESPIARLADSGRLPEFAQRIEIVAASEEATTSIIDTELDDQAVVLLDHIVDSYRSTSWRGQLADFVTPRDLLHSPTLTPIARWGLGLGERLNPWWCKAGNQL